MGRQKDGVNKSEEIRQMLRTNPRITAKEVSAALAGRGIKVSEKLYYLVKGKMLGKRAHKKKMKKNIAKVAASTGSGHADAVSAILKIKSVANELGGLKRLKAVIDALTE